MPEEPLDEALVEEVDPEEMMKARGRGKGLGRGRGLGRGKGLAKGGKGAKGEGKGKASKGEGKGKGPARLARCTGVGRSCTSHELRGAASCVDTVAISACC